MAALHRPERAMAAVGPKATMVAAFVAFAGSDACKRVGDRLPSRSDGPIRGMWCPHLRVSGA